MDELVSIRKKDLMELIKSSIILDLMENTGVDNWPGVDLMWDNPVKKLNLNPDDPDVTEIVLDYYAELDFKKLTTC